MQICPGCGEENPPKFRLCGYCGVALAAAAPAPLPVHEMRKTVTIIFSDLKDSTALGERIDTEALHEVKERYFSAMAAEIARHGGKVEKYIGDAIMAVFGLPKAHEDDALRAVRAAIGMRGALDALNAGLRERYGVALANRTGINTGEVVANDDPTATQKLATGDAVNVAARLEQAAPVGQIYLGATTWRLVRDAVEVETVEPLTLKGKAQTVAAYRLVSAGGLDGNTRRVDTPLMGRDAELGQILQAWQAVCSLPAVRLVTVIGDAGMGKSRLVHESVLRLGAQAQVLRGRCLPYGDGITFWPLVDMVGAAAQIQASDTPELARQRLQALTGDADVAARLASAIGLSAASFPLHELNWAARSFLQGLARQQPLVAVIDDIHWAEPAFLELIEHVLDTPGDAPILLLATARHDLLEEHPQWPGRANASNIVLRPLSDAAATQVVAHLLGDAPLPPAAVARIVKAADGNPLYVEQMLSMLIDNRRSGPGDDEPGLAGLAGLTEHADDEIAMPPTIQALLEARLDKLRREERATVEPAAVIGLRFAQPAVESLAPSAVRQTVPDHLVALRNKHFIDTAESGDPDPMFRFHHHLVREAVYNGLLKRSRANLHVNFVRWADQVNAQRGRGLEFQEILGYHLEQAHRYLGELGPLDAEGLAIGQDAAQRLASAGKRAFARGDLHAAANLLRRATDLLPEDDPQRAELLPDLGETLVGLGDFAAARTALDAAMAAADRLGNPRIKASSQVVEMFMSLYSGQQGNWSEQTLATTHGLIPLLEQQQAHSELATAWRLVVHVHGMAGHYSRASEAAHRSTTHARLAGNERLIAKNGAILSMNALYGPTPVPEGIALCEQLLAAGLSDRRTESGIVCTLAQLKAMNGELDAARSLYRRARSMLRNLGQGVYAASTGVDLARIELHGGDLALAEREVRVDYDFLAKAGETYFLSTMAALLCRIVRDQGRDADALAWSAIAEQATAADDIESQALWRSIRAPITARAGDVAQALVLAGSAVALARGTESPILQADALLELAGVQRLAGQPGPALQALAEARALYLAKGNGVSAARCEAWAASGG